MSGDRGLSLAAGILHCRAQISDLVEEGQLIAEVRNPEDGERLNIADGETVKLSTKRGSIEIPVEYTWRAAHGYCLMPHYFGLHYQGKMRGMHANYLIDGSDLDPLTGNALWRHTPCRVEKLERSV